MAGQEHHSASPDREAGSFNDENLEKAVTELDAIHDGFEHTHKAFDSIGKTYLARNPGLEKALKVVPPIAFALEGLSLVANTYRSLQDSSKSPTTRAGLILSSAALAGTLVASVATFAVASPAAAAVYVGYCTVNALKNIAQAFDKLYRIGKPAHDLERKLAKRDRIQAKLDTLSTLQKQDPSNEGRLKTIAKLTQQQADLNEEIAIQKGHQLEQDSLADPKLGEFAEAKKNIDARARDQAHEHLYDAVTASMTALGMGMLMVPTPPTLFLGASLLAGVATVGVGRAIAKTSISSYKAWRHEQITKGQTAEQAEHTKTQLLRQHLDQHYGKLDQHGNAIDILNNEADFAKYRDQYFKGLDHEGREAKEQKVLLQQFDENQGCGRGRRANALANTGKQLLGWVASGHLFRPAEANNPLLKGFFTLTKAIAGVVVTPIATLAGMASLASGKLAQGVNRLLGRGVDPAVPVETAPKTSIPLDTIQRDKAPTPAVQPEARIVETNLDQLAHHASLEEQLLIHKDINPQDAAAVQAYEAEMEANLSTLDEDSAELASEQTTEEAIAHEEKVDEQRVTETVEQQAAKREDDGEREGAETLREDEGGEGERGAEQQDDERDGESSVGPRGP